MKKLLTVLAMLAIAVPAVAEDRLSLGTGFDYSSGKYGNATSTDILYIPLTGKYESDKLTLKLTVPYIRVTGTGNVIKGLGRIGLAGTKKTTNSGLGDITASAGYNVYSGDSLSLDLVGNVKLGTADVNKGLGTGQNDYSAQVDGYYALDQTTLFATAGHKVYGSPSGINLSSASYGTIGASQKLSKSTSAGLMLDMANSPSASSSNQKEVTVYISQKVASSLKVQASILKGFSDGSPNYGFGAMITGYF